MRLWIANIAWRDYIGGEPVDKIIGVFSTAKSATDAIEQIIPDLQWRIPETDEDHYEGLTTIDHLALDRIGEPIDLYWVAVYPVTLDSAIDTGIDVWKNTVGI